MERSYPIPPMTSPRGTNTVPDKVNLVQREESSSTSTTCDTCASLSCDEGYSCIQTQPSNFDECPYVRCEASENIVSFEAESESNTTEIGPIVGGVLGGLALIAIVTYLVWRFCIKPKRHEYAASTKVGDETTETSNSTDGEKEFVQRRDQRSSTHTMHSIASTVLTRASNIIQIAYIPGVTNRTTPASSPGVLVPPVPPIPLALSNANSPCPYEEPHFFVPGDLRDSTYSGFSGYTDRTSYARTSYAARTSMAPSIASAVISAPPITGIRGKAAIVSLKSTGSSGPGTPPVPSIDFDKYSKLSDPKPPQSPGAASAFSVGSTFLQNASASTATQVRPQIVRVASKTAKVNPLSSVKKKGRSSPLAVTEDDQHLHPGRGSTTTNDTARDSAAVTIIDDTSVDEGPFSDPPGNHNSTTSLSAVIEEATRRAARTDVRKEPSSRDRSPFSDDHATND